MTKYDEKENRECVQGRDKSNTSKRQTQADFLKKTRQFSYYRKQQQQEQRPPSITAAIAPNLKKKQP